MKSLPKALYTTIWGCGHSGPLGRRDPTVLPEKGFKKKITSEDCRVRYQGVGFAFWFRAGQGHSPSEQSKVAVAANR